LEPWARRWYSWVSSAFLKSYMELAGAAAFVPRSIEDIDVLVRAYLLEKALYEVTYELNNRPDWVRDPLHAIPQLLLEFAGLVLNGKSRTCAGWPIFTEWKLLVATSADVERSLPRKD